MISEDKTYVSKACSGSVTEFDFDFFVTQESDVACYYLSTANAKTSLENPTHFTVASADWNAGGTVTLVSAYSSGTLIIYRANDYLQSENLINDPSIEYTLDKLTAELQEIKEQLGSCVRGPVGESVTMELIPAGARGNSNLVTAADGSVMVGSSTGATASAAAETLLDDATIADMRTTLDVYSKAEITTLTVTMQETVAAMDPVGINEDGWVKAKRMVTDTVSGVGAGAGQAPKVCMLGTQEGYFVAAWEETAFMYVRIGHLTSAGAISWDTAATQASDGSDDCSYPEISPFETDKFVIIWSNNTDTSTEVRIGSLGSSVVTWETDVTDAGFAGKQSTLVENAVSNFDTDKFIIFANDSGDSNYTQTRLGSLSGGAVNWETALTRYEAARNMDLSVCPIGTSRFCIVFQDSGTTSELRARIGELDTGAVSWITNETEVNAEVASGALVDVYMERLPYREDGNCVAVSWEDSSTNNSYVKVLRLGIEEAGTIECENPVIMPHGIGRGQPGQSEPRICVSPYEPVVFASANASVNGYSYGSRLKFVKNNWEMDEGLALQETFDCTQHRSAFITRSKVVIVFYNGTDTQVDAVVVDITQAKGVAAEVITAATSGKIQIGEYQDCFTGLTAGKPYFIDYPNQAIAEEGDEFYGTAISATEIIRR